MSVVPSSEIVERLREKYSAGTRVELLEMADPYRMMPKGLQGTVTWVDDTGTICVDWDNGSSLGVLYGIDRCCKQEQIVGIIQRSAKEHK